jgi:drug/metabolite transporter (DMT)-like permease
MLVYLAIGVLNFYLGRLLFYTAVAGLGAASSAIMASPVPLTAGLFASLVLNEELSFQHATGLTAVSVAVYMVAARPSGKPLAGVSRKTATIAGVVIIAIFTISTVAVRWASQRYGSPLAGVAISYAGALTSALSHTVLLNLGAYPALKELLKKLEAPALVGGLLVALAQASRYLSLSMIPVADAVSLISLFPINTVIMASMVPGLGEKIRPRHILASFMAAGGIMLTLRA